jgi:hypothetical protein
VIKSKEYCCEEFEDRRSEENGFEVDRGNEEVNINGNFGSYAMLGIQYCPYCGVKFKWIEL